jgi:signal transduction histidine kinase
VSTAELVTLALGVVGLCVAALNGFVYVLRRTEERHFWLALAAFGVTMFSAPMAGLYDSTSPAEALELRRGILVGMAIHSIGFVRFIGALVKVDLERFLWFVTGFIALLMVASFVPGLTYSGAPLVRPLFGGSWVDAEPTALGSAAMLTFLGTSAWLFVLFVRHAKNAAGSLHGVAIAACLWFACALTDVLAAAGLVELPSLTPLGQLGFVLAFTGLLLQRFVNAMAENEARALMLERMVEQRAQTLREKELQLAHGERLAAAGTLAAGLAHEINNPIAFVLANLNHLQALRKENGTGAEIEEVLVETQEGVARLRTIVDELLRLARTGERVSEPVQLARVVESVLPIVRHEARGRVRIETQLAYAPVVNGDPGRLGQVVLNLIQNGIHALVASERSGTVRVSVASVAAGVELVVEDDGPGIPDHVLPRIFEPFFTTKRHGEGTGLGLAVTAEIVTRHGGTIDVDTSAAGARFRVVLPAAERAAQ